MSELIASLRVAAIGLSIVTSPALADKLIVGVNGYTLTDRETLTRFDALAFDDAGKVIAVGKAEELRERVQGEVIDGQGRTLLPGLTDAHGHVFGLGFSLIELNLAGTQSLEEAQSRIRDHAQANPGDGWIRGRGWNQVIWGLGRFPTAAEIDAIVSDRPVWLERVDGHAGWANTKALELAGITEDTPNPQGGEIERDSAGNATGVLVDNAMDLVDATVPDYSEAEYRKALDAALAHLAANGLTGAHDAGITQEEFRIFREYDAANRLTARIYAMIGDVGEDFDAIAQAGPPSGGSDTFTVRSVKLYADGALGSRGAALIEPYQDRPESRGLLFLSQEEINQKVLKALKAGYQTNVHAIGDAGNRQVLDAFAAAYQALGDGAKALRNRIEHTQVVALDDIPRFKTLDLIASMQPIHATSDMNMAEDRVGKERIKGAYAWRTFLEQGTVIAAGSDFPVEPANPFLGLHAAVTRQDRDNRPEGGWHPEQAMTFQEAFRAFTLDAAYAGHQEQVLGTLTPGKWADFILVDQDPFAIPPQDLWKIRVIESWLGGKRVFPPASTQPG
jgi:predicted amidohydrolase YtcJ